MLLAFQAVPHVDEDRVRLLDQWLAGAACPMRGNVIRTGSSRHDGWRALHIRVAPCSIAVMLIILLVIEEEFVANPVIVFSEVDQ